MAGLRVERGDGGVVEVWLDRPSKRNALHREVVEALADVFALGGARAFVFGSSEPRSVFSAGADLTLTNAERAEVSDLLYRLYKRMLTTDAPIIAVVEGAAVGGGAQLALASDLRIGGAGATFRFVGPGHGLAVGAWGLPSLIGRGRALELCLTMRPLAAEEALELGILDRLEDDPRAAALALARDISALDADAVARLKSITTTAVGLIAALEEERRGNRETWSGAVAGA
jgi:enoyl-CoA hydratase